MNQRNPASPPPALTLPPSPRDREGSAGSAEALRRFHLGASGAPSGALPTGLLPAVLHSFRGASVRGDWPFFALAEGGAQPTGLPLAELLERHAPDGEAGRTLRENLVRLEGHVRGLLGKGEGAVPATPLVERAAETMTRELALGGEAGERLGEALAELVAALPAGGFLVPFAPEAPLTLLALTAQARLEATSQGFFPEARELVDQAEALLAADDARRGRGREGAVLGAALGPMGQRLVDPSALSGLAGAPRRGTPLTASRRRGLEEALEALRGIGPGGAQPILVVRRQAGEAGNAEGAEPLLAKLSRELELPGWEVRDAEDPFAAAAEAFDREAERVLRLVRAAQRVRLEASGSFDPERHEPWLEGLSWPALADEELRLAAPVLVFEPAPSLLTAGSSLARLLLGSRPVQVLLLLDPGTGPADLPASPGDPVPWRLDPALFGLGYGNAFVHQGSPARPRELFAAFARALAGHRAGLHVIATGPSPEGLDPTLAAAAAVESRGLPLFVYDPGAAGGWWRRFDLGANPEVAEDWQEHTLNVREAAGNETSLALPFNFADFALMSPGWAADLLPVAEGTGHEDLVPMARWLELDDSEQGAWIPFVWGAPADGRLVAVAVSRRLALACRDHLAAWRVLQELAAVKSEASVVAARKAREEAEAAAEVARQELIAAHREEIELLRRQGTADAVDRLAAVLLDLDPSTLTAFETGGGGLDALAGRSVEEVADALMAALDPATLDSPEPSSGNGRASALEQELLALVESVPLEGRES